MTLKNQIAGCGAKTRKGGECTNPPMTNGRCRLHGGATPKGIASPNFKTGKYSKYAALPKQLAERANEYLSDPKLTELRENIAITDARLSELYAMIDTNESGTLWRLMQKSYRKYRRLEAIGASKAAEATCARTEFEKLLEEGTSQQVIWAEITTLTDHRRKLSESESKRVKDSQNYMTAEELQALFATISSVIKETVKDEATLRTVSEKLISLAGVH